MIKQNVLKDGIGFNYVYHFIIQHFHIKSGLDYITSIERGMIVLTDKFNKDSTHVVVGYNSSKEEFEYIMQFTQDTIRATVTYKERVTLKSLYYLSDNSAVL